MPDGRARRQLTAVAAGMTEAERAALALLA
jgi:hypothetical protein